MVQGQFKTTSLAFALVLTGVAAAQAGGIERGGYNIDLLFDPGAFVLGTTSTYVMPDRKLKNTVDHGLLPDGTGGPDTSVSESKDYLVFSSGVKLNVVPAIDCLFQYSQPWGAHTNPGANWAGANSNIETKISSDNLGATCSYKFDLGPGDLRFIGGAFHQRVYGFKDRLVSGLVGPFGYSGIGHLELSGEGNGWRAGVAYEIPDIALRASLVYNSQVNLDNITGSLDLTNLPPLGGLAGVSTPVSGSATMPQSLEFKAQSGIAPGWLAYGSVKWVDWSVLQTVPFYAAGIGAPVTSLNLLYRDGWTVSAGVGHKFNDTISGSVGMTWDRGVSHGYGDLTDTWTVNAGLLFAPTPMVEFRVGGAAGILTAGSSGILINPSTGIPIDDVSYSFGNDFVGALSVSARVKF